MKPTLPLTAALARFPGSETVDLSKLAAAEIDFDRKYKALEQWVKDTREVRL